MKTLIGSAVLTMACATPDIQQLVTKTPGYVSQYIACHDGDTCTFSLTLEDEMKDVGLNITRRTSTLYRTPVRLCGINAPELDTPAGPAAKKALTAWLSAAKEVTVETFGLDKYGRVLGRIYADGVNLNERLIKESFAVHYIECGK